MKTDKITAIDFETACENPASACAIGLVKIRGGKVAESFYSLIRPPCGMEITPFTHSIHGISAGDVKDAPSFGQLWPSVRDFIGSDVLCAHNARFDSRVLESALDFYKIERRKYRFVCTLLAARRIWRRPAVENHRLNTLCEFLKIELAHHNAQSDAEACAKLWLVEQSLLNQKSAKKQELS